MDVAHEPWSHSSSSSQQGTWTPNSDDRPCGIDVSEREGAQIRQGERCPAVSRRGTPEGLSFPDDSVFATDAFAPANSRTCPYGFGLEDILGNSDEGPSGQTRTPSRSTPPSVDTRLTELRAQHRKKRAVGGSGHSISGSSNASSRSRSGTSSNAAVLSQTHRSGGPDSRSGGGTGGTGESNADSNASTEDQALAIYKRYANIDDGPMQQMQMFSSFLHLHFPSAEAKANLVTRRSYLLGLPDIDLSAAPVLRHAVQAVCYAHMGSNNADERLIHESRRTYGKVLTTLSRQLERQPREHDTKTIVTAIMLMTLYDDALPLPKSKGSDWIAHYQGILAYLRARGPDLFDMTVAFDRLIFMNLRMPSIFIGLARRKHMLLGESEWVALADRNFSSNPSLGSLYRHALLLPGVLERVEVAIRAAYDESNLIQLCGDAVNLQNELHRWFGTISSCAGKAQLEDDLLHISDADSFDLNVEEQLVMTSNTTFHSFFKFSSYRKAEDATLYFIFCLIMDCSLLRILHFHPRMADRTGRNIIQDVQRDAFIRATMICRSIHFFSGQSSQGVAAYLQLLATLAMHFFEEVGAVRELGWCQAVLVAVQLRVDRIRQTQARTLCRMGDLVEPVSTLSRFRSLNVGNG